MCSQKDAAVTPLTSYKVLHAHMTMRELLAGLKTRAGAEAGTPTVQEHPQCRNTHSTGTPTVQEHPQCRNTHSAGTPQYRNTHSAGTPQYRNTQVQEYLRYKCLPLSTAQCLRYSVILSLKSGTDKLRNRK